MKNYNKSFNFPLSVDIVAAALLKVFILPSLNPDTSGDAAIEMIKQHKPGDNTFHFNVDYFIKLVETIIDPIQDNAQALGDLYNSLNGWVKTDSPLNTIDLRKKDNHVPFPDKVDNTYPAEEDMSH